jgi:hypothetical protein
MSDSHAPLTWESSTGTQPQLATSLPDEVVNCLENARYVRPPHLDASTCADLPAAPPGNLHRAATSCCSHELHLPRLTSLCRLELANAFWSRNRHDFESRLAQDCQPYRKPQCFTTCPRLGFA